MAGTDHGQKISIDSGIFMTSIVGIVMAIVFVPIVWIFTYYVLKDRKTERKRREKERMDLEAGKSALAEVCCEEKAKKESQSQLHELEQPDVAELDGKSVKELWSEEAAEEKDGAVVIAELKGSEMKDVDTEVDVSPVDSTPSECSRMNVSPI